MTTTIYVTNREPETTTDAPLSTLHLFQQYTQKAYDATYPPFIHQADVFKRVEQNKSVMLVAGTAAGKTLAIGVPLFHKLQAGQIKRILLMYPTIALMNDQRRVMDKLAELTGQAVGHIQGGMRRSALIAALNKPVIVATPDAIYWFFQKNVKYADLLIYGLSLVDEFVLDEAHLFNGLTLRNLFHLKERITVLAENMRRSPRWHVLTATPTAELRTLAGNAEEVTGRSKCGDVTVTFLPPTTSYDPKQRSQTLIQAVDEALTGGKRKILLVLNSAAGAHRLFEQMRGKQPALSIALQRRFGTVAWGELRRWLTAEGIEDALISTIAAWVEREGPFYLVDLQDGAKVMISTETLMAQIGRLLQKAARHIKNAAYVAGRENSNRDFIRAVGQQLSGRGKVVQALWEAIRPDIPANADPSVVKQILNTYLSSIGETLEQVWGDETLPITAPDFPQLNTSLEKAGLSTKLVTVLACQLKYTVKLDEEAAQQVYKTQEAALDKRRIALRWLGESWLIKDAAQRRDLQHHLEAALKTGKLKIETRHIAVWGKSEVPAVIYTGQMSRRDREGLIEAFDKMPKAILVSTPAVEVGVDFKAEVLITEECDGNGFLQRFGRVGRTGEGNAEVIVLLQNGETWGRLQHQSQPQMSREDFSRLIIDPAAPTDPERSLFPDRTYAAGSIYLDATHWLVNRQIGRIGEALNRDMFPNAEVPELAQQMLEAETPFAYGLRGTMPGVSLLGGGGGSPFYVLSRVNNKNLITSDSPFETAQAQMSYTRFLYQANRWRIQVDWQRTLTSSRAMFYQLNGRWRLATGFGVAKSYLNSFNVLNRFRNNLDAMRRQLEQAEKLPSWLQEVARLGDALNLHTTPYANLILGQGDVFLERVDKESGATIGVEDHLYNPLVLSDQLWLYIMDDADKARQQLRAAGLDDLAEVHYPHPDEQDFILLDEVAGGCFYIYERLVNYAA